MLNHTKTTRIIETVGVNREHIGKGMEVYRNCDELPMSNENAFHSLFIAIKEQTGMDATMFYKDYHYYIRLDGFNYKMCVSLNVWLDHLVEKEGNALESKIIFFIADEERRYVHRERYKKSGNTKASRRAFAVQYADRIGEVEGRDHDPTYRKPYYYPDDNLV